MSGAALAGSFDDFGRLESLYNDITVDVRGRGLVSEERKSYIGNMYRGISAGVKLALEKTGLIPKNKPEMIQIDDIEPEDGVVSAYTDGHVKGINVNIIPGTSYYSRFRKLLRGMGGRIGSALYEKYGTTERAEDSLSYATCHEDLHDQTQLFPLNTKDGRTTKTSFREALYINLKNRYSKNLPNGFKWLAPFCAYVTHIPALEGLNEVATENVWNKLDASEVASKRKRGEFSYDKFASVAADAIRSMGKESALEFYRDWAENPGLLDKYIKGFFGSMRNPGAPLARSAFSYGNAL
jgi:hypothetical protein